MEITAEQKLELALAIMNERMVEQYERGTELLEQGTSFDDLPEDIFVD